MANLPAFLAADKLDFQKYWEFAKLLRFCRGNMLTHEKKIFGEFPRLLIRALKRAFAGVKRGECRGINRLIQFHDRI